MAEGCGNFTFTNIIADILYSGPKVREKQELQGEARHRPDTVYLSPHGNPRTDDTVMLTQVV